MIFYASKMLFTENEWSKKCPTIFLKQMLIGIANLAKIYSMRAELAMLIS